jgi:hypothetical protein
LAQVSTGELPGIGIEKLHLCMADKLQMMKLSFQFSEKKN